MKKKLITISALCIIFICITPLTTAFGVSGSDIVNEARRWCDVYSPYQLGARGDGGPGSPVDCSGLTLQVYGKFGISLPHSVKDQATYGTRVSYTPGNYSILQPGDLLIMNNYGHCGIYSGNGNIIHASSGYYGKVVEVPMSQWADSVINEVRRLIGGSSEHTHSYGGAYYEAAHPHREYQVCGCGATRYTGATGYMSSCSVCNPPLTVAKWVECKRYCAVNSGQTVNLYKNPTDTSRSDYFSKGQKFWSWRYAVLSNGTIRYEVETANNGIMYFDETGKMSVNVIHTTTAGRGCDAAHPHARYSLCECGYKEYTGAYDTVADCDICNPSYTLTYDANGGSGAPQQQKYKENDSVSVSTAIPYKEGAVFLGWANSPTATTAAYVGGDVFTMSGRDTVLYAVWASKQGQCGDNAYYTIDDDWTLTIGGTGDMYDYASELEVPWYNQREQIQKVVMNEGITSIGDYAFYGCANVNGLNIPTTVITMGYGCLSDFGNNIDLHIPNTVLNFKSGSLRYINARKIYLPKTFSDVNESGLYLCFNLEEIEIDSDNPYFFIDNNMIINKEKTKIYLCPAKTKIVNIPNYINEIGDRAFAFSLIDNIIIPENVEIIGERAFFNCPYLNTVYITGSDTQLGEHIFNKYSGYVNKFGCSYPQYSNWPFDVTVYAPEGSTAEEYVSQYYQEDWQYTDIKNISFIPLSEAPAPPTPIPTEAPTINPTAAPAPTTAPTARPIATEEPIDKPNSDSPSEPDEYDVIIESFDGNEVAITSNFSGAAKLLVAKYRGGMLVDCEIVNLSLSEGPARIPLQNDMTVDAGENVKIMIWDTNMRPYNVEIRD